MADHQQSPGITSRFAQTTSIAHERAAGNPQALTRLSAIDRRADAIKAKVIAHARKFEDRWVAKEGIALWKRRLAQDAKHPAPAGMGEPVSEADLMRIAARNVQARVNRRLSKVNGIKTRLQNAVVRNLGQPKLRQDFNQAAPDRQVARKAQRIRP